MIFQLIGFRRNLGQAHCPPVQLPTAYCPPSPVCLPHEAQTAGIVQSHQGSFSVPCPNVPTLGAPEGKNENSAKEAECFANRLKQKEEFSTTIKHVYRDLTHTHFEEKKFILKYDGDTPQLLESSKGKEVKSQVEVLFFADGKIYNARGEAQGRFVLSDKPTAGQKDCPLLYAKGTFERKSDGIRQDYDPLSMTLGGKKVFVVNAAPPGTVPALVPVAGRELESRANGSGLIIHLPKAVGYEVEWLSKSQAESLQQKNPSVGTVRHQIEKQKLQADRNGIWTLADGTRVGSDEGRLFVLRDIVLPAKHPLGSSEILFGKTGQQRREYLVTEVAPTPRPVEIPVEPAPKSVPKLPEPQAQKSAPMTPEPSPEKLAPMTAEPPTQPQIKAKAKVDPDPRGLKLEVPELLAGDSAPSISTRSHQLRMLQHAEACAYALELLAKDKSTVIPPDIMAGEFTNLSSPKAFAEKLEAASLSHMERLLKSPNSGDSIRLNTSLRRMNETAATLRGMPESASAKEIADVCRTLREDLSALAKKFSDDFLKEEYHSSKPLKSRGKMDLEEMKTKGFLDNSATQDAIDKRAEVIAAFLGLNNKK